MVFLTVFRFVGRVETLAAQGIMAQLVDDAREHGEDGEHRTFSAVSTAAHSAPVGGSHLRNTNVATRHGHHRNAAIS